jgi:hypothetical protein
MATHDETKAGPTKVTSRAEFEALWQRSHQEPSVRTITPSKQIEFNLTIDDVLERYANAIKQNVESKKVKKEDFDDVIAKINKAKAMIADPAKAGPLKDLLARFKK